MTPRGLITHSTQRDGYVYSFWFHPMKTGNRWIVESMRETTVPAVGGGWKFIVQRAERDMVSMRTIKRLMKLEDEVERLANLFGTFDWKNTDY